MFIQHGNDDICPHCGSQNRYRLLWLYLLHKTNFFNEKLSVLDIAPFHYFQDTISKQLHHQYISLDIDSGNVSVNADINLLPFNDNRFDCIFCYHVLEHVKDDKNAIKELFRVLKCGGFAIIQSPINVNNETTIENLVMTDPLERERLFGQHDHFRLYGQDYADILSQQGFQVIVDDFIQHLDRELVDKYCLDPFELIYYCEKINS